MEPSEDLLGGLLAAAPDALVAVHPDGRIVFVNDEAERLFGWARGELVGQPVERLVPDRFTNAHPARRASYVAHPSTRPMGADLDLWARRRDGSEFPAEISLSSFTTADGPLVAAAIRDVTLARRSEQRFRAVLASAPDAIVGVDASGRIEMVNAQAERLFGWAAEDLVGAQIEVLVPESALGRHVEYRARYVQDPEPRPMGAGLQLSARRKDGSTFPAEISLSTVDEEAGDLLVLAAVRDVSERIELEAVRQREALAEQREQSHRLESLGQLAGGVAHDFNNLLGVVMNYTTLVARRVEDAVALADLGEIRAAAERAAGLTRQLLTFASRDVANPEPLEVNGIVGSLAGMLHRTLGEHIDLHLDLADAPLTAVADRHQLEQIVVNLVINARDAMPAGGVVTVSTRPARVEGAREADVVLSVIDAGCGMAPEVAERAFEPFFTTKPTGEGTGLGLATVYGIVQQSGGEVRIDSEEGAGTTVTVTLRGGTSAADAVSAVQPAVPAGSGERVLLVEDEVALRVGMVRVLEGQGYAVAVAGDGVEALALVEAEPAGFDVVLTDVVMPRMRGDELSVRLAELHPGLPVILMSGYAPGDRPTLGPLLPKPVPEEALLEALREALDG